jgi:hypothetical protein
VPQVCRLLHALAELGASEVRTFLLHQIEVEQLAYASYRQVRGPEIPL